ncbi:Alpha/Beta hydrolase protein [Alternaria rosae]|uniref:Alpha/Beta hydrolase protein n=1 Tax=Alternaria rosae TaxID=1187941 RepID=UPI001E8E20A0|nr:Alpha/Beta hydrolase protein [Alternaria rosae]KAH6851579.1 Alpha/Beta hydrolase protein [Alternaria rosae]
MATQRTQGAARDEPTALLWHISVNKDSSSTILFIHGAFADAYDWDLAMPHIHGYHLLLPDCPGHGRSSHIPFSIETSAEHIARLVEAEAIGGRAHVVGHSLGASIAVRLAYKHPQVVESMFISGYSEAPVSRAPLLPYLLWASNRMEKAVPRPWIRWLMDGTDIRHTSSPTLSLCTQIARTDSAAAQIRPWSARTLIIVAGKGGLVPSNDSPEAARKLAKIGKENNTLALAYTHPDMRHPWNRQDPRLWAETVVAWVERKDIPAGFVPL